MTTNNITLNPTMSAEDETADSLYERGLRATNGLLTKIFTSCEEDPKGSIHRAWGLSLIFVVLFFIVSFLEMLNLHQQGGSKALVVASIWTGIIHLILGVLGTFVLKRFPTNFSVGFFLGTLIVLANQNLLLFGTFYGYSFGNVSTNRAFANLMFCIFLVLAFFALLLFHFKSHIVVAPIDAKGFGRRSDKAGAGEYELHE